MVWHTAKFELLFVGIWVLGWGCEGSGTFSFDIHHRFSDRVKHFLGGDGLPDVGTLEYYKASVRHDLAIRGRRLASNNNQSTVSFVPGNLTREISLLHYANVTVGTPAEWFLVGLDTGSDLFWLPCNCSTACVRSLETDNGEAITLNVYNPSTSSSSSTVPCNNALCPSSRACPSPFSDCPYQVRYLSKNTITTGILMEDVLHLATEDAKSRGVNARITLGCSQVQTGLFRQAGVNGLMGLGLAEISVPNILAKAGVAANSFSMCFVANGNGRISFGDKGSSDQQETRINRSPFPFYNVTITQIGVGSKPIDTTEFSAIFDSGTAVTWLLEPHYTSLTTEFNSLITDSSIPKDPDNPFEFCYEVTSALSNPSSIPAIDFTMDGGSVYRAHNPVLAFSTTTGGQAYCLAVLRQDPSAYNIVGQNFMTNYRIVHDRERMILGWKASDCSAGSPSQPAAPSYPYSPYPETFSPPIRPTGGFLSGSPSTPPSLLGALVLLLFWFI